MNDLTGFQRDIIKAVATLDGQPHGTGIREFLEDAIGYTEVHNGRIYPNLETLVEKGLLRKGHKDGRTSEYRLTRRGRREIEVYVNEWHEAAEAGDVEVIA